MVVYNHEIIPHNNMRVKATSATPRMTIKRWQYNTGFLHWTRPALWSPLLPLPLWTIRQHVDTTPAWAICTAADDARIPSCALSVHQPEHTIVYEGKQCLPCLHRVTNIISSVWLGWTDSEDNDTSMDPESSLVHIRECVDEAPFPMTVGLKATAVAVYKDSLTFCILEHNDAAQPVSTASHD